MRLQGQHSSQVAERLFIACDVSNLWRSCREEFGPDAKLDFRVLADLASGRRYPAPTTQELTAYIVTNPRQKHEAFCAALHGYGYQVRARYMTVVKAEKDRHIVGRTDWDVGITIDAIDRLDNYDTFVLMSGDGDFTQLLAYLKRKGKRTLVFSFHHSASRTLREEADEFVTLQSNVVFFNRGVTP